MPDVYRSPSARTPKPKGITPYVVPVGEGTIFTGGAERIALDKIVDGSSNTIMILQVADSAAVTWTKPEDRPFDVKKLKHRLANKGINAFLTAFADASVRTLPINIDPKTLELLLLRDDGQPTPDIN